MTYQATDGKLGQEKIDVKLVVVSAGIGAATGGTISGVTSLARTIKNKATKPQITREPRSSSNEVSTTQVEKNISTRTSAANPSAEPRLLEYKPKAPESGSPGIDQTLLRAIRKKYGARRIADNPRHLKLWNEMLEDMSTRDNAVSRYLRGELKPGESLSDVFNKAQQRFATMAKKQGIRLPRTKGQSWEIHHWNFQKHDYRDILLDPGHLFFVSKPKHTGTEGIHNFLTGGSGTTTSVPDRFRMEKDLMDIRPPVHRNSQ